MKRTLADWGFDRDHKYLTVKWLFDGVITRAKLNGYTEPWCTCTMRIIDLRTVEHVLPIGDRCDLHRAVYEEVQYLYLLQAKPVPQAQFPIEPTVMK